MKAIQVIDKFLRPSIRRYVEDFRLRKSKDFILLALKGMRDRELLQWSLPDRSMGLKNNPHFMILREQKWLAMKLFRELFSSDQDYFDKVIKCF